MALFVGQLNPPEEHQAVLDHIAGCALCRAVLTGVARACLAETADPPAQAPGPWSPPQAFDEIRILRPLGRGAQGQVYLGYDANLDRQVAVKFIAREEPGEAERQRFLREARALARLSHPNIVTAYRFGEVQGRPYLVSEFVPGQRLDELDLPVQWEQALPIAADVARGLAAAHRAGVLHRDIKLANAILAQDGEVKLVDFGLAKVAAPAGAPARGPQRPSPPGEGSPADLHQTRPGSLVGTPIYMAPELWRQQPASRRSDVFAAGVLLYVLCSGGPPQRASTLGELCREMIRPDWQAPPLAQRVQGIDPGFAAIVDRCLQRDPQARFFAGEELARALEGLSAREVPPPRRKRPRLRRMAMGAVIAMVVVGGGWLGWRWVNERGRGHGVVLIQGGTLRLGSSDTEVEAAFNGCRRQTLDPEKNCDLEIFRREGPLHEVVVSPYFLDATEVTISRFVEWLNQQPVHIDPDRDTGVERWVRDSAVLLVDLYPSYSPTYGLYHKAGRFAASPGFEQKPVTQVTWDAGQRYCLSQRMRLPTEAEWEFAARGSGGRRFPWGHEEPRCDGVAFDRGPGGTCSHIRLEIADVASSPMDVTDRGIFDLGGNVQEWVLDLFRARYTPCAAPCRDPGARDGALFGGQALRVIRGGSYAQMAAVTRAAGRSRHEQSQPYMNVGFRCARPRAGVLSSP